MDNKYFACPVCLRSLNCLPDGLHCDFCNTQYPRYQNVPVLYHHRLLPFFKDGFIEIPLAVTDDPFILYYKIWTLKNNFIKDKVTHVIPEVGNLWVQKHYQYVKQFVRIEGSVLDIGCGFPTYSKERIGSPTDYFGLDPFFSGPSDDYALFSAEYFPIKDASFDNVTVLAVLDHIIDYMKVIDETFRVLKPGGNIFLSTLVWAASYELVRDSVHFHHFKEYEIFGALHKFNICETENFPWKEDYRSVLFIKAQKPN